MYLILLGILLIYLLWKYPKIIFGLINIFLPRDDTVYYSDIPQIFPATKLIENLWEDISREALLEYSLKDSHDNYLRKYNIDLGNEDTSNWSTINLKVFDKTYDPPGFEISKLILKEHPEIKSWIFSYMEPHKIIEPHYGPYNGLIRYQMPLRIPDGECYLEVANQRHYWVEGQPLIFDETKLHRAVNNSQHLRVVLLIDIERPGYSPIQKIINKYFIKLMGII